MVNLLNETVEGLVASLMPWLDLERSRSLSRSGAVRRPRSQSLSKFWKVAPEHYEFLQLHFDEFSLTVSSTPKIGGAPPTFPVGIYSINSSRLAHWRDGDWKVVRKFDAADLLVSFQLGKPYLYFEVV